MKPIHLSLSGLQSYRDKQEIDFTGLSDAGVFGIFGPTGSGKSSILDAMTLALYGKVERAPGGTQGIINQMETVCSVSFTFELSDAGGSERYRVDRQYKRTGEVSVNQTLSRLMRIDNGETAVLADKAKDVDSRVMDILGLSMADFTRAVVLPQGKFAEFLSLKGVERRHMLERLFHLEQYGDLLGAKVNAKSRETDMAVKRTEAEQLGLGDASAETLQTAQDLLEAARQAASGQREILLAAEREAEDRRRLWKLVQEQAAVSAAEQQLEELRPEIEAGKLKLRMAEKASRIEHFLKDWETAQEELAKAEARLSLAEEEHKAAEGLLLRQQIAYGEAKARLERDADPLQSRLEGLNRALELHGEIRSGEQLVLELTEREGHLRREMETAAGVMSREQQQLEKALALQAELKARLAAIDIKPEHREKLQAALLDNEKRNVFRSQIAHTERELREASAEAEPLRQSADQLEVRISLHAARVAELAERGIAGVHSLNAALAAASELERSSVAGEETEKRREQEQFRAALAVRLAESLTDGEPCPVCGSGLHPAPAAAGPEHSGHHASNGGEQWRKLAVQAAELRITLRELISLSDADLSRLDRVMNKGLTEPLFRDAAAAADPAITHAVVEGNDTISCSQALEKRDSLTALVKELERDIRRWSQSVLTELEQMQSERNRMAEEQAKLAAINAGISNLAAKIKDAGEQEKALLSRWPEKYPGLIPETVVSDWEALQTSLREQDGLRERLAKSEPYLEAQHQKLNQLKEESFRLERDLVGVSTERKGQEAMLAQKRGRLAEQLKGSPDEAETKKLYLQAEAELQSIKNAESEGRRRLDALQQEQQNISVRLAAVRQAKESAAGALERSRSNGQRELAEAGFGSAEAARSAVLHPAAAAKLEADLQRYQDRLADTRARLSQLAEALGGRSVTETEWNESETKLAAEREKDEECLRMKAKLERDLEDLQSKHERWLTLERERLEFQTLLDRLQKLQSVLRGNAFVEFMAGEQLQIVSKAASERLSQLTRRRYALETDSTGGFVIRDDANGGLRRPVSTLSGGETFLTSLSLALALSAQIQLNGKFPLEFFFLDEGFGTLDPDLLETVVNALEKLHMEQLTVGVISHVPELKSRLPRRLVVIPADPSGPGSRISFETL